MTPPKPPFFPPWLFKWRTIYNVVTALAVLGINCLVAYTNVGNGVGDWALAICAAAITLGFASCWITYRRIYRDWSEHVALRRKWDEYFNERERGR